MKKIKIMLLSLALFAVVGGALAFKAKFNENWCVTDAYSTDASGVTTYYCDFGPVGSKITTTCGGILIQKVTTNDGVSPILRVCTTLSDGGSTPCNKVCPELTSTKVDGF